MSHPLFTHRVPGPCNTCWEEVQYRLANLEDLAVVETHRNFITKSKKEKVIFEGRKPRQLRLVAMRDAERAAEAEVQADAEAGEARDLPNPQGTPGKENVTTMEYVRGLWVQSKAMAVGMRSPDSLRGKEFAEMDATVKVLRLSMDREDFAAVAREMDAG
ncbi:uncharacterized protein AB675_6667 [Cyphellophora attinorum]|uniref:Uncharacterized protein n=1 Tax=Cyphellophora attinorum TaxID=1664694 RepID=A0A0N1P2H5_9EURO|nr:uncharacterized protein AB675_6667 [Phialophora attinorum]KPI43540.1 hypothetical protein AB675_6667 [Phialophora attinorum]